ncbi:MAG: hypothetical protein A2V88_10515 [Elusimicrobia bacterium RBG_16_66_12]|nr:MAG: hypothetical protein A2V88_10515 [Elusimicrobia bacterium RBG_16_66_12]
MSAFPGPVDLYLYGGEPLLNRPVIDHIVSRGRLPDRVAHLSMTTNGALVDAALVRFVENNPCSIGVSVDGIRAAHDAGRPSRGDSGTFDASLEGLRRGSRSGKFHASWTLAPRHAGGFAQGADLFSSLRVGYCVNFLYEENWDEAALRALCAGILDAKAEGTTRAENFFNELNPDDGVTCRAHMDKHVSVLPSGHPIPCSYWLTSERYKGQLPGIRRIDSGFDWCSFVDWAADEYPQISDPTRRPCEPSEGFVRNKSRLWRLVKTILGVPARHC